MLKGFKDFILRGNVVELAIAVVIGVAFQAVVSAFVSAIITPIVNAAGGSNVNGLGFSLKHTSGVKEGSKLDVLGASTFINISTIINAIITFVVTAAVVYFIFVVPMNKIMARMAARTAAEEPVEEPVPQDVQLLEQIRDLLAQGQTAGPSGQKPSPGI